MGNYSKESLEKLLLLIDEISNEEEYLWFKQKIQKQNSTTSPAQLNNDESLNKIYEYCIKEIITKQANKFYEDFKIEEIKSTLVEDFIRMEHFRREDNFEDFCLAMFQQVENLVIFILNKHLLVEKTKAESNDFLISIYNKDLRKFVKSSYGITIGNFIFQKYRSTDNINVATQTWYFANKYRAVLFYLYFNSVIEYNTTKFEDLFKIGNDLYQIRNLNHRGAEKSEYQQKIYDEIIPKHNQYYFKFLGFLEDFMSIINKNL